MDLKKLEKILHKEPAYRLNQVSKAIFSDFIGDWQEATILPLALREKLNLDFPLTIRVEIHTAKDEQTQKALITLDDDLQIETVLLCHEDGRNTVCVSSQVGCPLGCLFCATGKSGFARNLTAWEIVCQVLLFARNLKTKGQRVSNVVFMGMGEPFLNYDNVLAAINILNAKDGFDIGARHISISTIGITEGIKKLAKEKLQVNLAISLHAPNNELRDKIVPMNHDYPIENIFKATEFYLKATNRQVMLEYLMIKDFNDSEAHARQLIDLLQSSGLKLVFVNLIAYNQTQGFKPSPSDRIRKFKQILIRGKIRVTERFRFGQDIKAACGQLAAKNYKIKK